MDRNTHFKPFQMDLNSSLELTINTLINSSIFGNPSSVPPCKVIKVEGDIIFQSSTAKGTWNPVNTLSINQPWHPHHHHGQQHRPRAKAAARPLCQQRRTCIARSQPPFPCASHPTASQS